MASSFSPFVIPSFIWRNDLISSGLNVVQQMLVGRPTSLVTHITSITISYHPEILLPCSRVVRRWIKNLRNRRMNPLLFWLTACNSSWTHLKTSSDCCRLIYFLLYYSFLHRDLRREIVDWTTISCPLISRYEFGQSSKSNSAVLAAAADLLKASSFKWSVWCTIKRIFFF